MTNLFLIRATLIACAAVAIAGAAATSSSVSQAIGCRDIPHGSRNSSTAFTLTLKSDASGMAVDLVACPLLNVNLTLALEPRQQGNVPAVVTMSSLQLHGGFVRVVPSGTPSADTAFGYMSLTVSNSTVSGVEDAFVVDSKGLEVQNFTLTVKESNCMAERSAFVVVAAEVSGVTLVATDSQLSATTPKNSTTMEWAAALSVLPAKGALRGSDVSILAVRSYVVASSSSNVMMAAAASVGSVRYEIDRRWCVLVEDVTVSLERLSLVAEGSTISAASKVSSAALAVFGAANTVHLSSPAARIVSNASSVTAGVLMPSPKLTWCPGVTLAVAIGSVCGSTAKSSSVTFAPMASLDASNGSSVDVLLVEGNDDYYSPDKLMSTALAAVGVVALPQYNGTDSLFDNEGPLRNAATIDVSGASISLLNSSAELSVRESVSVAAAVAGVALVGSRLQGARLAVALRGASVNMISPTGDDFVVRAFSIAGVAALTGSTLSVSLQQASFVSELESTVTMEVTGGNEYVVSCASALGASGLSVPINKDGANKVHMSLDVSGATIAARNTTVAARSDLFKATGAASFITAALNTGVIVTNALMNTTLLGTGASIDVKDANIEVSTVAQASAVAGMLLMNNVFPVLMNQGGHSVSQLASLTADNASVSVAGNSTKLELLSAAMKDADLYRAPGSSVVAGFSSVSSNSGISGRFNVFHNLTARNASVVVVDSGVIHVHETVWDLMVIVGVGTLVFGDNASTSQQLDISGASILYSGSPYMQLYTAHMSIVSNTNVVCGVAVVTVGGSLSELEHATHLVANGLNVSVVGSPSLEIAPYYTNVASIGSLVVVPSCGSGRVSLSVQAADVLLHFSGPGMVQYSHAAPPQYQPWCEPTGVVVGSIVMDGPGVNVPGALDVSGSISGCPFERIPKSVNPELEAGKVAWFGTVSPPSMAVEVGQCYLPRSPPKRSHSVVIVACCVVASLLVVAAAVGVVWKRRQSRIKIAAEGTELLHGGATVNKV